jgi:hypothetical protein
MFEAASIVGPRYKPPTYEELREPILQNEKANCTQRLQELRYSWQFIGCTVMSDGWTQCRAADIPCKSTFNCQPGKVDLEEPAQEMQG